MKFTLNKYNRSKIIKDLVSYIHSLELKKPMNIEIIPEFKNRSKGQNAFYWVWIKILCIESYQKKACEVTKRDTILMHEDLKMHLLQPIKSPGGNDIYSTKFLSTIEFDKYCEEVRMAAIEVKGVSLFYPSDRQDYDEMLSYYEL